jgi:hypothetical protein
VLVSVGLLVVPGASLAGPPTHSNANGNGKAEKKSDESAPAPEETAPADDGSSGSSGPSDPAPDQGSGDQGSGGAGGGAPADEAPSADNPSSNEATDDTAGAGSSKKEKSAAGKPEDKTKPPGNNGTVKVDGVEFDDHPNNEPHVGCTFQIDFYGYDEGEDLFATATFVLQPPTTSPTGDDELLHDEDIFIGEDEAGGGTDLDASRTYNLAEALEESGATPHPIQGFHVKLTVHAEGSIGADVKHKVFWVLCEEEVGGQEVEVIKVWLEDGEEAPPPDDLKGSFRLVIEGQGENTGTLVCRVDDENNVDCDGDLVINDPDEPLKVTELNAPEGWEGPDEAFATCAEEDEDGTCIEWEIRIENVFVGGQLVERRFEVTKIWVGEEGPTTTRPPDIPEDLEIILEDDDGNQLVCSYQDDDELSCEGTLDVDTGDTVTVTEEPPLEGWIGDETAVAVCTQDEEEDGTIVKECSFTIRNLLEVLGRQERREIIKLWDGSETPPANLPDDFVLIIEDPDEGGRLECVYDGSDLECTGSIRIEDGETLVVDEENAPPGWSGPETVTADCETVQDEGGAVTTCTVTVANEFAGGGRPPEVLPRGPVTPEVLAVTGIEAEALLALAMILLGTGATVLAVERRRRRAIR